MFDYELFRKRLKFHRQYIGLTQEMLAERANITWSFLSKIESGQQNPSVLSIINLLNTFGMTLEEFMGNQNSQDKIYNKEFILAALKAINKGKDYGK